MQNNVLKFKREFKINELPDDLITISNCADIINCSGVHIRNLIKKGKIREYQFGYKKVSLSEALKAMGV